MTALAQQGVLEEAPLSVGSFLKQRRVAKGLTQRELAEASSINISSIKQYERHGAEPTLQKLGRIAEVLEFDPAMVIREALEPGSTNFKMIHPQPTEMPGGWVAAPAEIQEADAKAANIAFLIERIERLVKNRGLTAKLLPKLIGELDRLLEETGVNDLEQLLLMNAPGRRSWPDISALDDASAEATGQMCDALQSLLVISLLYGESFANLELSELRELHKAVAQAARKDWPLQGVPVRNMLSDIFTDEEKDNQMRQDILLGLPPHMIEAIRLGRPVIYGLGEEDEDGERDFEATFTTN